MSQCGTIAVAPGRRPYASELGGTVSCDASHGKEWRAQRRIVALVNNNSDGGDKGGDVPACWCRVRGDEVMLLLLKCGESVADGRGATAADIIEVAAMT